MSHNVRDYRLHLEGSMSKYVRDRLRPVEDLSVSVEVAGIHELLEPNTGRTIP